jgi:TatD DNase family protein
MIDTHTHLYVKEFKDDIDQQIVKAQKAGIKKFLLPNIDADSIEDLHHLVSAKPDCCLAMMGLHPCSVFENYKEELKKIRTFLVNGNYIGVGEIGLDFYWDKTFIPQQVDAFITQLNWAQEFNLPVSIHCRESLDKSIEILESKELNSFLHSNHQKGVFHCFGGTIEQAKKVIDWGFKIGIGGVVTFKNGGLEPLISEISLEHIVLETDSPYLAPAPHRGKRNEPWMLELVANRIAEIKKVMPQKVKEQTTINAKLVFSID